MVGGLARVAQSINSKFLKAVQRKGNHRENSRIIELSSVADRPHGEESDTYDCQVKGDDATCWVPHPRTGIYYPKGQESVMEDIPVEATKAITNEVHWFSCNSDVQDHFFGSKY